MMFDSVLSLAFFLFPVKNNGSQNLFHISLIARYDYLLARLTRGGHNVLYMGDTGVGKSVVMEKYLEKASNTDAFVAYTMKYSAQTKPTNLKDMFETKLEKKRKTLFGPPSGKKMLFFIDDLNMPALEVCCCCCCCR